MDRNNRDPIAIDLSYIGVPKTPRGPAWQMGRSRATRESFGGPPAYLIESD